jgi:hypothetical protein
VLNTAHSGAIQTPGHAPGMVDMSTYGRGAAAARAVGAVAMAQSTSADTVVSHARERPKSHQPLAAAPASALAQASADLGRKCVVRLHKKGAIFRNVNYANRGVAVTCTRNTPPPHARASPSSMGMLSPGANASPRPAAATLRHATRSHSTRGWGPRCGKGRGRENGAPPLRGSFALYPAPKTRGGACAIWGAPKIPRGELRC